MSQIVVGHLESDGAAINLPLGFVPDVLFLFNANAAAAEVFLSVWFGGEMDDAAEIQFKALADNGNTGGLTIDYVSSGGYISDWTYTTSYIDKGTSNDDDDPVRITAQKGVTISADFSDDSDELWYIAIGADKVKDHGDINA